MEAGQGRPRGPRRRAAGRRRPGVLRRPRHQASPTASPTTCGTTRTPASCSARSGSRCGSRWCARCRASAPPAPSTSSTRPTSSSARDDATFFDSHVTYGLVSALEPVGLMRKVGLAETLRIALTGNDERVTAETALRISLVTEVVARDELWDRAHEIAAGIARKPSAATQGTVRAIWESLDRPVPRRHAAGPHLHPPRQPDRRRPRWPRRAPTGPSRGSADRRRAAPDAQPARSPRSSPSTRPRRPSSSSGRWHTWGDLGGVGRRGGEPHVDAGRAGRRAAAQPPGPGRAAARPARAPAPAWSPSTPTAATDRVRADLAALDVGTARRRARRPRGASARAASAGSPSSAAARHGSTPRAVARRTPSGATRSAGVAVEMLTSGTTGPPEAGAAHLRDAVLRVLAGAKHYETQPEHRRAAAHGRGRSSTRRWSTSAGLFRVLQCVNDGRSFCLLERFTGRRVGRRRAPPPAPHREPGARRAAHGARRRPRPGRPRERPLGGLAAPRRSTPTTPTPSASSYGVPVLDLLRGHRVRRRRRRAGTSRDHEQFWAAKRGSVGRAHAGCELRVVDADDRRRRSVPTRRACSR